jgi:hypothetical protein
VTAAGPRCPRCGQRTARRCERAGRLERLLSVVYVYPFRCQVCTGRFRALRWGTRYAREKIDRREYERAPVNVPASFVTRGMHGRGQLRDLSLGGCGIESDFPLVAGDTLRLELHLPRQPAPIVIEAATARSVSDGRIGIHFDGIARDQRKRLHEVMLGLLGYAPHTHPGAGAGRRLARLRSADALLATIVVLIVAVALLLLLPRGALCLWHAAC